MTSYARRLLTVIVDSDELYECWKCKRNVPVRTVSLRGICLSCMRPQDIRDQRDDNARRRQLDDISMKSRGKRWADQS